MLNINLGRTSFLGWIVFSLLGMNLACGGEVTPTKIGEIPRVSPTPISKEGALPQEPTKEITTVPPAPSGPTTYQIGEVIRVGDLTMVVLGWEVLKGDQFNKPDPGKKFVAIDVIFVNHGSKSRSLSSLLQMNLKDETGQNYDVDLSAQVAAGSSPQGELSPGERLRGKVGFQVPEDAKGLVFVFDANIFGTGKVFVDLGPEPIVVEPPPDIVGEHGVKTFAVGDQIRIGDLVLIVHQVTYPPGDQFNKPEPGNKFVVIDLTLENKGSEDRHVSSLLQMYLKDEQGRKYELDLAATVASGGSTPDGEIAPGEKLRGQVGFQIPENAKNLVFVFDADVFDYGKVFVTLP